jgi:tetratricopeptide (TPR) repeat protein
MCQDWDKTLKEANYKLSINDRDGALKEFEKQVRKHPNSGACHTGLGKTLKRQGKYSEAKAKFLKATEVEPTYADGFYELGSSLEADKEWAGAADAFQKYCELNPDGAKRQAVPDRVMHCRNQIK